MKNRILVVIGLLAGLMSPWALQDAAAQQITANDAQEIRVAVQSQLDAFSAQDAVKAFSLSTTSTRIKVGNPDNLMRLIKEHYTPLYNHQRVLFSEPAIIEGHTLQLVRITDDNNTVWVALYKLQREYDGTWKIEGCKLFKTAAVSI